MKTIEELAKECGAYIETGENDEHLEALCKAYMKDRLKSLEPVAWKYRYPGDGDYKVSLGFTDEETLNWMKYYYKGFEIHGLHDISSLLEKE